jgi:hypothetical protein
MELTEFNPLGLLDEAYTAGRPLTAGQYARLRNGICGLFEVMSAQHNEIKGLSRAVEGIEHLATEWVEWNDATLRQAGRSIREVVAEELASVDQPEESNGHAVATG